MKKVLVSFLSIACTLYPPDISRVTQTTQNTSQTPSRHPTYTARQLGGKENTDILNLFGDQFVNKQTIPPKGEFSRGKQLIPVGLKYLCKTTDYTFSIWVLVVLSAYELPGRFDTHNLTLGSNMIMIAVSFWKHVVLKRCLFFQILLLPDQVCPQVCPLMS